MKFARVRTVEVLFAIAVVVAICAGALSSWLLESRTERQIAGILDGAGLDWLEINPNGALVELSGIAPSRTLWLQALTAIHRVVPESRIVDRTTVADDRTGTQNDSWIRLVNQNDNIFIFGVFPDTTSHNQAKTTIDEAFPNHSVVDASRVRDGVSTPNWQKALAFGIEAFLRVSSANVSISASRVNVVAHVGSTREREILTTDLARIAPSGIDSVVDIAATLPIVSPYTLQFKLSDDGASLPVCHAESDSDRNRIAEAAVEAGVRSTPPCRLARGAPSPDWANTIASGILLLHSLGGGRLDARNSLIVIQPDESASSEDVDRLAGNYVDSLSSDFILRIGVPGEASDDPFAASEGSGFRAAKHADGSADIAGTFPDELSKSIAVAFAQSTLETMDLNDRTEVDTASADNLLDKILPGIEALSFLREGNVRVADDMVEISGTAVHDGIPVQIDEMLGSRIGNAKLVANVIHDASIDFTPELMSPQECVARAADVLAEGRLEFESGASELSVESRGTVERLTDVLMKCTHVNLEIAGFTDSSGGEAMNLALSSDRARSVLAVLLENGVLTSNFTARGYGEAQPIASNETVEGREKNRRIEIRLPEAARAQ